MNEEIQANVVPTSAFGDFCLRLVVIACFAVLLIPPIFGLWSYIQVVMMELELSSGQKYVFDTVLSGPRGLPVEIVTLLIVAVPLAVAKACYIEDSGQLNVTGKTCLVFCIVGFLVSAAAYIALIDDGSPIRAGILEQIANVTKLSLLRGMVEISCYAYMLYGLTFFGLKPK